MITIARMSNKGGGGMTTVRKGKTEKEGLGTVVSFFNVAVMERCPTDVSS